MPRTIVPPEDGDQLRSADRGSADSRTEPPDGLSEKLVKYVPAETLAFFEKFRVENRKTACCGANGKP